MDGLSFELGHVEHAKAIQRMRHQSSVDLTAKLGPGHWSAFSKIASVRDRLRQGDPERLRHSTIYVACRGEEVLGSVVVSTYPPGFWKKRYWRDPRSGGLGVFNLVVVPEMQGQGIGRFLMAGVEQLARERRIPFVRLDAYSANPFSTAFYRHIGYEERAVIDLRGVGLILFEKSVL